MVGLGHVRLQRDEDSAGALTVRGFGGVALGGVPLGLAPLVLPIVGAFTALVTAYAARQQSVAADRARRAVQEQRRLEEEQGGGIGIGAGWVLPVIVGGAALLLLRK